MSEAPAAPTAALSGTVTDDSETDIRAGGSTIILTLTGDTWDATVGADNAITTALIAGLDADGVEAGGWDLVVKAGLTFTDVTRTSSTVVTITLPAFAGYNITALETITATIPASALVTSSSDVVATPTFDVTVTVGLVVNSTGDAADATPDGVCDTGGTNSQGATECTLRAAIDEANALAGTDAIDFNIPTTEPGYTATPLSYTISPATELTTVTDPANIDGATQPGYAGTPIIVLDGNSVAASSAGLRIDAGNSLVRGLVIGRVTDDGLVLFTNGGNTVQGNYIGVDVTGSVDWGNAILGLEMRSGSSSNQIGGTGAGEGNVISANVSHGIYIQNTGTDGNIVEGNYIGTNAAGTGGLGNQGDGIRLANGASSNVIGGTGSAGNVISDNGVATNADMDGVRLMDVGTDGNIIRGNYVGTDHTGLVPLGNSDDGISVMPGATNTTIENNVIADAGASAFVASHDGIYVEGVATTGTIIQGNYIGTDSGGTINLGGTHSGIRLFDQVSGTTIGGSGAGEGNVIANWGLKGVFLQSGTSTGNSIRGNVIRDNSSLGIDLQGGTEDGNGVTDNDVDDVDTGPNNLQNYPILSSAQSGGGSTTIQGTLNSYPSSTFTLDFYSNSTGGPSGHGDAAVYLGADAVSTDVNGDASFTTVLPVTVAVGDSVTATATISSLSTSEFSANIEVTAAAASVALSGTITDDSEADIVAGGSTIILTLTGDTWDATVGADNAITTALIAGLDADGVEAGGWDLVVKAGLTFADVTRTSSTVVTITLPAFALYDITAPETITATIPASALVTSSGDVVATPTFDVTVTAGNTAPTVVSAIPDTTVNENNPTIVNYRDLNAVFTDAEDGSALNFIILNNTNPGLVTPSIAADSTLDLSFTASTSGGATITIRATDSGGLTVDDVFTVIVNPAGSGFEVRVAADNDDAEEKIGTGAMDLSSSDLELIAEGADQEVGMRFQGVMIPPGATITNAYVEFTTDETTSGTTNLTFWALAEDNPNDFSTGDITSRPKSAASVQWNSVPAWNTVGEKHQTPDLSAIIQETVNRGGWANGNALTVIVTGTSGSKRIAESYDGASGHGDLTLAPLLHVDYFLGGNTPPTVAAAIPDTTVSEDNAPIANYRDLNAVFTDAEDGSALNFFILSNTNPGLMTPSIGADSTLDLSFTASTSGSATITIRATDSGALTVDDVFTVTVTPAPPAALSGTVTDDSEADIRAGGSTIILTLTGDTWDATVGADNAITTALIAGLDADGVEAGGWDLVVKAGLTFTDVARTSSTVVTITLPAFALYDITAPETITATIPASALVTSSSDVVATPTFDVTALDTTPPDAITDLATGAVTSTSVDLTWTAPGDDGSTGTATSYDIRYSTSPITAANWSSATQVTGEPAPQAAGTAESFTVTGLSALTTYYFAIKTSDEVPNESGLSNVVSATTLLSGTAQTGYAWSDDVASFTSKGDNVPLVFQVGTVYVIGVQVAMTTSVASGTWVLQVREDGAGSWLDVFGLGGGESPVWQTYNVHTFALSNGNLVPTSGFGNGTAPGGFSAVDGEFSDDNNGLADGYSGSDIYTELQYTIRAEPAAAGHNYEFRVDYQGAPLNGGYSIFALADSPSYGVVVAPNATSADRLPSNGTNYTVDFTVINQGNSPDAFDLLTTGSPGTTISVVSMTGAGVTQGANPDSAQTGNLAAGDPTIVTVTYSVAGVAEGTLDTLLFTARSVGDPAMSDDGRLELTVIRPQINTGKAVDPSGTQVPNTDLTYTITLTNTGSEDAQSVVTVDSLPTELRFKVGSVVNTLPAGISRILERRGRDLDLHARLPRVRRAGHLRRLRHPHQMDPTGPVELGRPG